MGALHAGHLSLVAACEAQNDVVVVSIFVNPTQFNNANDLEKYPKNLDRDLELLKDSTSKPLIVFAPNVEEIYSESLVSEKFDFNGLEHEMEGQFRPGHFDGVATIVSKLFKLVQPQNAYFGEKDYQQVLIIQKMTEQLQLPVNIVPCKIHREEDGLAMSSRNERLSKEQRLAAPLIYKMLLTAKAQFGTDSVNTITEEIKNQFAASPLLSLEYFTIADAEVLKSVTTIKQNKKYRAFIAAYAGEVRLIDNMALN
jgi:pantoate--beta-alanine ligase